MQDSHGSCSGLRQFSWNTLLRCSTASTRRVLGRRSACSGSVSIAESLVLYIHHWRWREDLVMLHVFAQLLNFFCGLLLSGGVHILQHTVVVYIFNVIP